jgi:diketogulonate reductase-like aldo/keto reductase
MLTRRELLMLAAASALPTSPLADDTLRLPERLIPGTGESLPIIGLGSTKPVRSITERGTGPILSVLRELQRHGGRVVDTAPRPASLDKQFGEVLARPEFDEAFFLAAKINAEGRDAGIAQFRQTQRLFQRQQFDLVQIESLTDLNTHWPTLRGWQADGDARFIGVTVAHERLYPELERFMRDEKPDFVQLNYSVVEHSAEERLLPLAADLGIAILVNGPFINGEYFGLVRDRPLPEWSADFDCRSWAEFALKFILANPAVTCVLTETTNPHHLYENLSAALGPFPDADQRQRMREFANTL